MATVTFRVQRDPHTGRRGSLTINKVGLEIGDRPYTTSDPATARELAREARLEVDDTTALAELLREAEGMPEPAPALPDHSCMTLPELRQFWSSQDKTFARKRQADPILLPEPVSENESADSLRHRTLRHIKTELERRGDPRAASIRLAPGK